MYFKRRFIVSCLKHAKQMVQLFKWNANMSAMQSRQNPFFRLEEEICGEDQRWIQHEWPSNPAANLEPGEKDLSVLSEVLLHMCMCEVKSPALCEGME